MKTEKKAMGEDILGMIAIVAILLVVVWMI